MDRQGRAAVIVLAIVYLVAFGAMLIYSMFMFPGRIVLPVLRTGWILWNGVALFIEVLPTAHLSAVLLLYSLFAGFGPGVRLADRALVRALKGPLVLFTVITMLFAVAVGIIQPYAAARRDSYVYQSEFARALLSQAQQFERAGEYERAAVDYALYLNIDAENTEVRAQLDEARAMADAREIEAQPDRDTVFLRAARREAPDATQLVNRAAAAIGEQDFFTAHYYARLALALDSGREEARRILANANEGMRAFGQTLQEAAQQERYERKRHAYWLLSDEQGQSLIQAYYAFADLRADYPDDRDIELYYPLALEAIQRVSFFLHEIERAEAFPARHNLTFRNGPGAEEPANAVQEFVHIDRMILASGGRYALGIEAVQYGADGEIIYHLRADYGKIEQRDSQDGGTSSFLNMRAVDRQQRTVSEPHYLSGARDESVAHVLEIRSPVSRLELLAAADNGLSSAAVPDLLQKARIYPDFGFAVEPVHVELGMRFLLPFSLLIFSLFGIALGIRWRSHYLGRAPLLGVLALFTLPFVLHQLIVLYFYVFRVLLAFLVLSLGSVGAAAALLAVQALLLAWALFSVAARMSAT
ncbi:MAG: LptF/LptG family permease [Spirochaetaceae bacterium]|nr:MAG: LptF/LptG family permease [Spirochaetaceae bacterium]